MSKRKLTRKDIERYNELTNLLAVITEEKEELRKFIIDECMKHGTEDGNKYTIQINDASVTTTHIIKSVFSQSKFKEENKKLYDKYKEEREENRVSVKC